MWSRTLRPKIPSCDVIRWVKIHDEPLVTLNIILEQKIRQQQKPIIHFLAVVVFEKPLNFEQIATEANSRGVDFWSLITIFSYSSELAPVPMLPKIWIPMRMN